MSALAATSRDLSGFVSETPEGSLRLELAIEGIDCAACMPVIEHGVGSLPGVTTARLNLTNRRLTVIWDEGTLDPMHILARLEALGFRAHPFDPARAEAAEEAENKRLLRCLAVAAFASMNVMLLSVSVWSGNVSDITPETRDLFHWVSALIALPAAAYAGRPFFESAIRAVKARALNMDVPITLGILLALGLSVFETLNHAKHAYFDSAVMLLFFLLAGRFLDQNMRRRTRAVAENLTTLRAESATKLLPGGGTRDVPLSKVDPGDLVLVRPGERVAVDGVVEDGRSEVDQSLVTGETALVATAPGSRVYAGTLNGSGALTIRVTAAAKGTFLDEVQRLLENAAQARSRYVRLADRASRLYAPVVHALALATLIGWLILGAGWHFAVVTAIAVLIITCPCALGLAIPAVQVVASQTLFTNGVLLHSGDAIERLAAVDTIVFDKTGTLTLPHADIVNRAGIDPAMLASAARLAAASRHPLAQALAGAVPHQSPPGGVSEVHGKGVTAEVDGGVWRLGSPHFCGAEEQASVIAAAHPGASLIAFRRGGETPVVLAIRQGLRSDAVDVIARLAERGIAIEILSGDRKEAVADVAKALGITRYLAGATPREKVAHLEALKAEGRTVLMVGDGLNDAPALQAAHVSMSPVTAVHLSQAAADAVFLGERLGPVLAALGTARKARRIMTENLWLSVIYNFIAVPVAVVGLVTPLVAALAMSGSSVLVTLNALRARPAGASA
jgi:Cu2+-exporting ATPase